MEIEIVTTKKKLTKAIVEQMRNPSLNTMKHGEVMGFLIHIVKESYKSVLIQHDNDYFTFPTNWKKGERSVYRKVGKWSQSRKFDTLKECNEWWSAYQSMIEKATTQIYI